MSFVEKVLPSGILRHLAAASRVGNEALPSALSRSSVTRAPLALPQRDPNRRKDRRWEKAQKYIAWLLQTDLPKLFFWVTPAVIVTKDTAERLIQELRNTKNVYLGPGLHYVQEDYPHAIGLEIAQWLPVSSQE